MGTKPFNLMEARIRFPGSTYTDAFTAMNDATWVIGGGSPNTRKVRFVNGPIDVSGLTDPRLPDPSVRTRGRGLGRGIRGKQEGTFVLPIFLNTNTADNDILEFLEVVFGGLSQPGTDTYTLDSSGVHTTSRLYSSGVETDGIAGRSALCGTRGDGRGNGEVIEIVANGTDYIDLGRETSAAMQDGDVIWISHTVFPDMDATQSYFEVGMIGDDSTSPDQLNCIGCQVTEMAIDQIILEDGEMPILALTIMPGRFRHEPAATKATISHATPTGADPVALGIGGFWITPEYSTAQARGYLLGGQASVTPGIRHVPIWDPQRYNAIGGFRRAPGNATWSFVAYTDEGSPLSPVPDLESDYEDGTAHQVVLQYGHAADSCMAIRFSRSYLDRAPYRTELNEMTAFTFEGHAEEFATTNDLIAADIKIDFFHT